MGVHQFLSWLRARHNTAFRAADASATTNNAQGSSSGMQKSSDSPLGAPSPSGSPAAGGGGGGNSSVRRKHGSLFEVAAGSDYAVIAVDINAMLHEVASSVTNDQQSSRIYDLVEREILRRLSLQIDELVRIAGGDSLRLRSNAAADGDAASASATTTTTSENASSGGSGGVFTRDVLIRANPHAAGSAAAAAAAASGGRPGGWRGGADGHAKTDSTLFTLVSSPEGEEERRLDAATYGEHRLLPVDVLLVVDGVAPLGKCAQQRERRSVRKPYGSSGGGANDTNYFQRQQQMLLDRQAQQTQSGGRIADQLGRSAAIWDANAITVGTPFMNQVCAIVHYTAANLVRQYRNLRAWVSDASVPGEGEQKIFTALKCGLLCSKPVVPLPPPSSSSSAAEQGGAAASRKKQQQQQQQLPEADTRRICICSNDTDSIIMALLLIDDEQVQRPIDIWRTPSSSQQMMPAQRRAHEATLRAEAEGAEEERARINPLHVTLEQEAQKSWVFDMQLFAEELKHDFHWTDAPSSSSSSAGQPAVPPSSSSAAAANARRKRRTFGGAMRSFAFMISIFGGDFLPRVADLSIADGDLDDLIEVLGSELFVRDRWIVDPVTGVIDLQAAMYCLRCLADRKYGVNVVPSASFAATAAAAANSNNNRQGGAAGTRRGRPGISLVMGDVAEESYNPFGINTVAGSNGALTVKPNLADTSSIAGDARRRELVSVFWEGLIWVGRYFDGVTVSWSWFFKHPGGALSGGGASGGGLSSSFNGAPRLRDLISDETVLVGRASEMAARAAAVYQALLRGDYATIQSVQRLPPPDSGAVAAVSTTKSSSSSDKNASSSSSSAFLVMTAEEINPVAVGASVLPDVSWPNLLPRALADILRQATDSWNEQRTLVQQQQRGGGAALALSASALSDDRAAAAAGAAAQSPESLAFEFIRSLKVPVTSFDPLTTVGICARLIAAIQHRFTREELRLLKRKYTYRLNWASLQAAASAAAQHQHQQQQQQQQWSDNVVSDAAAAAARKLWNEKVVGVSYSDLLALPSSYANSNASGSDTGVTFGNVSLFPPFMMPSFDAAASVDGSNSLLPRLQEFSDLIRSAAESQQRRDEQAREQSRKMRAQLADAMHANNNSASSHPAGWYTVPGAIRFTGTASAANLTAFPTFSNTPVAATGGGEAIMLQVAVQLPV